MNGTITERKEKKVEYIELVYDLIFVYMLGRNNSLLQHLTGGFVDGQTFLNYLLCTLAVIQLWTMTTYYINLYGRHSVRDHAMLFVNMFLLYFLGEGTRTDWQTYHTQYHVAWALILLNIALQYLIEYPRHRDEPAHRRRIVGMSGTILCEVALIVGAIFEFNARGTSYLSFGALAASIVLVACFGRTGDADAVDFSHLSERAMLYVVFTFGEMIIAIARYFDGDFNLNSLYFSAMAFLIVVGLLLSYGIVYDHLIDREKRTDGVGYMILHIFIIFALNNVTTALEFMRDEAVELKAKILFISLSLILFYACLLLTRRWAKTQCRAHGGALFLAAVAAAAFPCAMFLLRGNMRANIALTVLFVFAVFLSLYRFSKTADAAQE